MATPPKAPLTSRSRARPKSLRSGSDPEDATSADEAEEKAEA